MTSEADILERHKAFIQEQGYKKFVPKLPYAYLTVKCHKDPIGSRFIVGVAADQRARNNDGEELSIVEKLHFATTKSPECSTTAASVWLDKELKKVMTLLEANKDKKLIAEQGISRYWIIEDMERFFRDVKIKDAMGQLRGKKPRTTDFTTMYTSLQQVDIVNNVGKAVEEALNFNERCSTRNMSSTNARVKLERVMRPSNNNALLKRSWMQSKRYARILSFAVWIKQPIICV